jgi:two-component system, OmpR family, alkaline phosphatase synthesis response regulator PhoP
MSRVLIVEDEANLAKGLQFNLEAEGHSVKVLGDGESALQLLLGGPSDGADKPQEERRKENKHSGRNRRSDFDAVLLDVMLPGKDGFVVASELRAAKNFVPVLMLTARGRPEDVLRGFASGADDYLPKPFELAILLARLQGLLRRSEWMSQTRAAGLERATSKQPPTAGSVAEYDVFSFHDRSIDFGKLELRAKGNVVHLTLMEAELLRHLIRNSGQAVSRKSILEEVWGLHEDTDTRAIDNFIVRLRRYIEDDPAEPRHLLTVRGVGYRFMAEPEA